MGSYTMEPYSRIDSYHGKLFSYEDLKLFTNNFSDENYIGRVQFGRVYRGKIPPDSYGTVTEARDVTVKIWADTEFYFAHHWDNVGRLTEEVLLLKHWTMEEHPHLVKLIGFCNEGEHLGVVYDLKPLDTVHNLATKDNFSWIHRIKVALEFACIIEYFHAPREPYRPYLIRNIDAAHIMLDQDYNTKLFDFSMIAGGIFPERRDCRITVLRGCHGFSAYDYISSDDIWSENYDVFAFGVLLLCLMSKRMFDLDEHLKNQDILKVADWAESKYKARKSIISFIQSNCSLVHPSFKAELEFYPVDGPKITKLAMRCLKYSDRQRPTMKQVIDHLLNLHVVRRHANRLGIQGLVRGRDLNPRKANLGEAVQKLVFKK